MDELDELRSTIMMDGEDNEEDAKGIKLFPPSDTTKSCLKAAFKGPLQNVHRRRLKEKFGVPNTPCTAVPSLDKVLKSRVSPEVKAKDKEISKLQALALDAIGQLAFILDSALDESLTAKDNIEAVQTAVRLLGNFAAHCNRERRTKILKNLDVLIADLVEEEDLYSEAGQSLFGDGFCKKAKEGDDEMRALNRFSAQPPSTKNRPKDSGFRQQEKRHPKDRGNSQSSRGRSRFSPYAGKEDLQPGKPQ